MIKISLPDLSQDFLMQGDGMEMFLNLETAKTFFVTLDISDYVEDENYDLSLLADWQREEVERIRAIFKTKKYISLPSKHDINEWQIMEDFCATVNNPTKRARLNDAIHGKGAFHRFKSEVEKMGLLQDWYDYKETALLEMARTWCEKHDIPYESIKEKPVKQQEYDVVKQGKALTLRDGEQVYLLQNTTEEKAIWADFREKLYGDIDAEALAAELGSATFSTWMDVYLIWTAEEKAIGFLELSERNIVDGCETSPVAYLEGIYIVEAYRGKGLGQQLIEFCKQWTKDNGMSELATDSSWHDVTAQKFHARMGFEETERIVQFKMRVN